MFRIACCRSTAVASQTRVLLRASHALATATIDEGPIPPSSPTTASPNISINANAAPSQRTRLIPDSFLEHYAHSSPPSLAQRTFANVFFQTPPKLLFTAGSLHQVTHTDVPEVAFLGRSNVGKSTLLNTLMNSRLCRTSARPGRTRTMNAFATGGMDGGVVEGKGTRWRLTLLDMPGYGHGSWQEWGKGIEKYLVQRKELKRAFVLINASHGLKDTDRALLQFLRSEAIPHQVVLSKVDQMLLGKNRRTTGITQEQLETTSAQMKEFVQELREEIQPKDGSPSAVGDVIACLSQDAGFHSMSPERQTTLGITALRSAILAAVGIGPKQKMKEEEWGYDK